MERSKILATMNELKLYGMKNAYDEIIAAAVKRQHHPERIVSDLLTSEIAEKQARSIKYQMTISKLPLAKDIADFDFADTAFNETLIRDLAAGNFLALQRNVVLIGGTGTGKTHLAIAIARACIRAGARGRFFNVVDLVNKLEAEAPFPRRLTFLWTPSKSTKNVRCNTYRPPQRGGCCHLVGRRKAQTLSS